MFALATSVDGIALRSLKTACSAQIDGAVNSAGSAEVDGLSKNVRLAGASSRLIVSASAVAASTTKTTEGIVRAANVARGSRPEIVADAFALLRVAVNTRAFAVDALMSRFADVAEVGEVAVANASVAGLCGGVVGADCVIAVSVVGVAGATDIAGLSSPSEIAVARGISLVAGVALSVSRANVVGSSRAV